MIPGSHALSKRLGEKADICGFVAGSFCAAFPAVTAVGRGLDAYVAVDACGTFSETKRQVGLLRMTQAGVILQTTQLS